MGITFSEVADHELLNTNILKLLPSKCKCGAAINLTDSLTSLYCTNDNCSEKIVYRLLHFCEVNNMELLYTEAKNIVDKFKVITPYQLLLLDKDTSIVKEINLILSNSESFISGIKNIKSKDYTLADIAKMSGVKSIELAANKIFRDFNSFTEAYNEIEQNQLVFIGEKLGTKGTSSSSFSLYIYNELLNIKEELLLAETQLTIRVNTDKKLKIAFNCNIENFCNKSEVIDYMNANSDYRCILSATVDNDTDILVSGINTDTNKCKVAKIINDKYTADKINSGEIRLDDIGKHVDAQLKPLGQKIYIDTLDNILDRVCNRG